MLGKGGGLRWNRVWGINGDGKNKKKTNKQKNPTKKRSSELIPNDIKYVTLRGTSGQDGAISRHTVLPHTTKRTTNLKTKNNQN